MKISKNLSKRLSYLLIAILTLTACNDKVEFENEVNADANFMFASTQNRKISVGVNDLYNGSFYYKIEIFDRHPLSTDTIAALLTAGVANGNAAFVTEIVVPNHITRLFVRQIDPLQRATIKIVDLSTNQNTDLKIDFAPQTHTARAQKIAQATTANPKASDYNLPSTYNTLSSAAVTLMGENNYLPANVSNSQVNFGWLQNSALYVGGDLTVNANEVFIPANTKIVVLPGGNITFNGTINFEQLGVVVAVQAGAKATFNNKASVGAGSTLVNDGTINFIQPFEIRINSSVYNNAIIDATNFTMTNQSKLYNEGMLNVSENFVMNSNTYMQNNGMLTANQSFRTNNITAIVDNHNLIRTAYFDMVNGGGVLNNYCTVEATGAALSGSTTNSYAGSIFATKNLHAINATINLHGDAIFKTGFASTLGTTSVTEGVNFVYNVKIEGYSVAQKSPLFIINNLTNKNAWQVLELKGMMEFVLPISDVTGTNYFKSIDTSVSITQQPIASIVGNSCNGGGVNADAGSGTPTNPDFPMWVNESNVYSFAMEDLWPNLGDYDMNDFVFTIKNIRKQINEQNKVLSLSFDIAPRAAGSTKLLSAALQFDKVAAGNVLVTSTDNKARMEAGHTMTNAILFENVHTLFGRSKPVVTNTFSNMPRTAAKDYNFRFDFEQAVSPEMLIISALNFYIIVDDLNANSRNEIHLAGFAPSTKVRTPTNNYKDSNNMVWALMLPVADFVYPTERTKIYDAYPQFNNWAAAAGSTNANWYLHPNTNSNLLFNK